MKRMETRLKKIEYLYPRLEMVVVHSWGRNCKVIEICHEMSEINTINWKHAVGGIHIRHSFFNCDYMYMPRTACFPSIVLILFCSPCIEILIYFLIDKFHWNTHKYIKCVKKKRSDRWNSNFISISTSYTSLSPIISLVSHTQHPTFLSAV